jgi:hypothetical protein
MLYDFRHKSEQLKAHEYLLKLIEKEQPAEIKRVAPKRSNPQNRYLHVLINLFAIEYGERKEYIKLNFLKKSFCPEIFETTHTNKKTGNVRRDWRSTASLDSKEMTRVIDKFRTLSQIECDIYLPSAEEYKTDWLCYLQTIENNKEFL